MQIPVTSEQLINLLNELYPEKTPDISMTDREIWMYAGKRELIRTLLQALKEEEDDS